MYFIHCNFHQVFPLSEFYNDVRKIIVNPLYSPHFWRREEILKRQIQLSNLAKTQEKLLCTFHFPLLYTIVNTYVNLKRDKNIQNILHRFHFKTNVLCKTSYSAFLESLIIALVKTRYTLQK